MRRIHNRLLSAALTVLMLILPLSHCTASGEILVEPPYGTVHYTGDLPALRHDISTVISQGCTSLTMYDDTDAEFTYDAYTLLREAALPVCAEYGYIFPTKFFIRGERGVRVELSKLDPAGLPEPYELMGPVKTKYGFSMKDSSGQTLTHNTFAGKRVMLVFGRLTCYNTMAFLSTASAAASMLRNADVEVIVCLYDLSDDDLQRAAQMFSNFYCVSMDDVAIHDYNVADKWIRQLGVTDSNIFPTIILWETDLTLIYGSTGNVKEPLQLISAAIGDQEAINTRLVLPASATTVGAETFAGCTDVYDVCLEDSLQSIGERAFTGCVNLRRIIIPASVKSIGPDAFDGCSKLTICCPAGSAAYEYAVSNGISWKLTN